MKITGKLLYQFGTLTVHQHADGYIISNGSEVAMVKEMPCLAAEPPRILLNEKSLDNYDRFQLETYGNILKPSTGLDKSLSEEEFDRWYNNQAQLMELNMMGY